MDAGGEGRLVRWREVLLQTPRFGSDAKLGAIGSWYYLFIVVDVLGRSLSIVDEEYVV